MVDGEATGDYVTEAEAEAQQAGGRLGGDIEMVAVFLSHSIVGSWRAIDGEPRRRFDTGLSVCREQKRGDAKKRNKERNGLPNAMNGRCVTNGRTSERTDEGTGLSIYRG